MAYTYLFDLYDEIDQRIDDVQKAIGDNSQEETPEFYEGRLEFLLEFRAFVSRNLDHKLPRKMRKKLKHS